MSLPEFTNPPINEVVCAVYFTTAQSLRTVDIGMYWGTVKDEFPIAEDQPPLSEIGATTDLEFSILPPLRRVWLHSKDDSRIIQIQENRFYYNWRRRDSDQNYPRFRTIEPAFQEQWINFCRWSESNSPGKIVPAKYELAYINHVDSQNGWKGPSDTTNLLRCFGKVEPGNLLAKQTLLGGQLTTTLPDGKGYLNISVRQATRTTNPTQAILQIELRAQSTPDTSMSASTWFAHAHEAIVNGFFSISTEHARKLWGYESCTR